MDINRNTTKRKQNIYNSSEKVAINRHHWVKKNKYFYSQDQNYLKFLVPRGKRILNLGCGTGELLAALDPSYGVGIDFSNEMLKCASSKYKNYKFINGDIEDPLFISSIDETYDFIVISDVIGSLEDCQIFFENLHHLCTPNTRIIISYYSKLWEPILKMAEIVGQKMPTPEQNWLSTEDIQNLLTLSDYDVIKRDWRQLFPKSMFGIGSILNNYLAPLPFIRRACLRSYVIARSTKTIKINNYSATVLIPCRNERGNIENAVKRLPKFCDDIEIIFVEGHSTDGTLEEIARVANLYQDIDIKVLVQDGKGKGDAVRKGFAHARGDILMIMDADLTTPPESMPKFYKAINQGKGEFINGTRLIYPMENEAMRFLNHIANRIFSVLFSWLLNQRFTDTLCGTKVISRKNYLELIANRSYFGEFDPFGDFDLIFGATKLNLKVVEIPVNYASRDYGTTQISRFAHGWLLLKMVIFAYKKLKMV